MTWCWQWVVSVKELHFTSIFHGSKQRTLRYSLLTMGQYSFEFQKFLMLVHKVYLIPHVDVCQIKYTTGWFIGWTTHAAFTHIRGLSCDQRPPPERTPISLGEENGFKPFSAQAMGCLRSNFNAAKKRQLLDLRELASWSFDYELGKTPRRTRSGSNGVPWSRQKSRYEKIFSLSAVASKKISGW